MSVSKFPRMLIINNLIILKIKIKRLDVMKGVKLIKNLASRDDEKVRFFRSQTNKRGYCWERCIRNDHVDSAFDDCAKGKSWKHYYQYWVQQLG